MRYDELFASEDCRSLRMQHHEYRHRATQATKESELATTCQSAIEWRGLPTVTVVTSGRP
jgi:hypothetical protein